MTCYAHGCRQKITVEFCGLAYLSYKEPNPNNYQSKHRFLSTTPSQNKQIFMRNIFFALQSLLKYLVNFNSFLNIISTIYYKGASKKYKTRCCNWFFWNFLEKVILNVNININSKVNILILLIIHNIIIIHLLYKLWVHELKEIFTILFESV